MAESERGRRRWLIAGALGGALSLVSMSAGWAAIQLFMFEGAAALSNAELDQLRGGFTLQKLPDVTVRFGFRFDSTVELPDAVFFAGVGTVTFDDPTQATVTISRRANGTVVEETQSTVDLTRERVRLDIGDVDRARVTQIIDAEQVTTLLQSTVDDATLTSNSTIGITLGGVAKLQSKLPSPGLVNTLHSLNYAVTQALR